MKQIIKYTALYSCILLLLSCTANNKSEAQNNVNGQHSNLKALKETDNLSWHVIGSPRFSTGGTDNEKVVVAPDGNLYVVFADYTQHNKLSVMRYDEANMKWVNFGASTISAADASDVSMVATPNGNFYLAFADAGKNNKATVMTYDKASIVNP